MPEKFVGTHCILVSFPFLVRSRGHWAATFFDFAAEGYLVLSQGVLDKDSILGTLVFLMRVGLYILSQT